MFLCTTETVLAIASGQYFSKLVVIIFYITQNKIVIGRIRENDSLILVVKDTFIYRE